MSSEKCVDNTNPESVEDFSIESGIAVMTCKDYRKKHGECPVYLPKFVRECDVSIIGKRGRIRDVPYSEYLEIMKEK